jgi:hypothetical protein
MVSLGARRHLLDRQLVLFPYEIFITSCLRSTRIPMRGLSPNGCPHPPLCGAESSRKAAKMMDIILLIGGLVLFAVAIAYAFACDRL